MPGAHMLLLLPTSTADERLCCHAARAAPRPAHTRLMRLLEFAPDVPPCLPPACLRHLPRRSVAHAYSPVFLRALLLHLCTQYDISYLPLMLRPAEAFLICDRRVHVPASLPLYARYHDDAR